jgi:hypothetical protein
MASKIWRMVKPVKYQMAYGEKISAKAYQHRRRQPARRRRRQMRSENGENQRQSGGSRHRALIAREGMLLAVKMKAIEEVKKS